MTRNQRIALARIVSDMIKADNIIDASEIKEMKQLMSDYSLSQQDMCAARKIRFSQAVCILQQLPKRERIRIYDRIKQIALSDSICVTREALLLLALKYCLTDIDIYNKSDAHPYLISCSTGESSLNEQYIVYIENDFDDIRNRDLLQNFRLIVTQSRLYGFNFIYIPKLVSEFKQMDKQYVMDAISYMAPNLENSYVENVYQRLCVMTTKTFYESILHERIQPNSTRSLTPSLFINVGTSIVPYCSIDGNVQYYTEFLCVPILNNTMSVIDVFLDFYRSIVSIHQTITLNDENGQFKYFGFYKALFDFLVTPPPTIPDLVFCGQDMRSGRWYIALKYSERVQTIIKLAPQEYDTYKQIVQATYSKKTRGLRAGTNRQKLASIAGHTYGKIRDNAPDLQCIEKFKPINTNNIFSISLEQEKIYERKFYNWPDYRDERMFY